jgi:hypothetical protein
MADAVCDADAGADGGDAPFMVEKSGDLLSAVVLTKNLTRFKGCREDMIRKDAVPPLVKICSMEAAPASKLGGHGQKGKGLSGHAVEALLNLAMTEDPTVGGNDSGGGSNTNTNSNGTFGSGRGVMAGWGDGARIRMVSAEVASHGTIDIDSAADSGYHGAGAGGGGGGGGGGGNAPSNDSSNNLSTLLVQGGIIAPLLALCKGSGGKIDLTLMGWVSD